MPDLGRWDPPVPIVLLDGMYMPYTDRTPPISGIGGDVREPRNIIWLCSAHLETYQVCPWPKPASSTSPSTTGDRT